MPHHPEAIATNWSLSFEHIQEKNPAAADLLRLCAYFAPDAIAEEILMADALVLGPVLTPMISDMFQRNLASHRSFADLFADSTRSQGEDTLRSSACSGGVSR